MRALRRLLLSIQVVLGIRVLARAFGGIRARPVRPASEPGPPGYVSVIVPVLDEARRIGPCLESLCAQGECVREILVVDGGSNDGTPELARSFSGVDARIRVIEAPPAPPGWNGKAWNLQTGLFASDPRSTAIVTIDADVRVAPSLAASLVEHAALHGLQALSIAARQQLAGPLDAVVHPALLATLVYRYGPPGFATREPNRVAASGQCFFAHRALLVATAAISAARDSRCEDVTIARALCSAGTNVGFYEADGLVTVRMYDDWRDVLRGWPRSLPMSDRYARVAAIVGLLEVVFVQALPGVLLAAAALGPRAARRDPFFRVQLLLGALRCGMLAGMRRAYAGIAPSYWLSPACDAPAAVLLVASLLRRNHTWRGRPLVDEFAR